MAHAKSAPTTKRGSPPENEVFRTAICVWQYLDKQHGNRPYDELEKTALDAWSERLRSIIHPR